MLDEWNRRAFWAGKAGEPVVFYMLVMAQGITTKLPSEFESITWDESQHVDQFLGKVSVLSCRATKKPVGRTTVIEVLSVTGIRALESPAP